LVPILHARVIRLEAQLLEGGRRARRRGAGHS
jgi:hypothetical protein